MGLAAAAVAAVGWCSSRASYERPELPADYRYVLTSSCGERALIGTYRVVVRAGAVTAAEPLESGTSRPDLAYVPTLDGLVDKANDAGRGAEVELELDDAGLPVSLSLDPSDAVDDEECYDVSGVVLGD